MKIVNKLNKVINADTEEEFNKQWEELEELGVNNMTDEEFEESIISAICLESPYPLEELD